MKRISFLSLLFVTAVLFSCKKEDGAQPAEPGNPVSSKDPVALSKNIKVWHGERIAGIAPAPKGGASAPVIKAPDVNKVVAFSGKYAIVKPTVVSGGVAGYYVGVKGAPEYFKINYTKPRKTERQLGHMFNSPFRKHNGMGLRPDSTGTGSGYTDSAIVVTVPANFQVPDTFCITYCAYDAAGNISEPVTTCIIVSKLGGDASTAFLDGTWRLFASFSEETVTVNHVYDTVQYGKWQPDGQYFNNYCNTKMDGSTYVSRSCDGTYAPCNEIEIKDSINQQKWDFNFITDGSYIVTNSTLSKYLDTDSSTCSKYKFTISPDLTLNKGNWSLSGNKIIFIYDYDENDQEINAEEYDFEKINDKKFRLKINYGVGYNDEYILIKL